MRKKTTYSAVFLTAAIILALSVFVMPGCSSSDGTTSNENVIQGTVTAADSGAKLEGVTVSVGDNSTTTDSNGFYKLTNFVGGRHILKASKEGYGNYSAEVIVSSWQPKTHNFSMTGNTPDNPETANVTGTVTDGTWNPLGVEGITVTVGGKSATTDSEGKYEITDIEVKNMTLTAVKEAYVDYSADVDLAAGTTTTHNFIMVLKADAVVPFYSEATNLTTLMPTPTPSNTIQVYTRNKYESVTEPVSLASPGILAPGSSCNPSISTNGRYVAYQYTATITEQSLSISAFQNVSGVFVYDRYTGETELVSKNSDGTPGDNGSLLRYGVAMSADGRYVVFQSGSTNLVDGDTNGCHDIFIHDRETGITKKVSGSYTGDGANNNCYNGAISGDGRYVTYWSFATNIVEGFSTSRARIYVYDCQTETTTLASLTDEGQDANSQSYNGCFSGDGQFVAFRTHAPNLGTTAPYYYPQIALRDRTAGTTTLISKNSSDENADATCYNASISSDGRYITYCTGATNLTDETSSVELTQIFLYDRTTGETVMVSKSQSGEEGNGQSYYSRVFSAGDVVVFGSSSSNLVDNDTNNSYDVFIYYIKTGVIERLSVDSDGVEGNSHSRLYYSI